LGPKVVLVGQVRLQQGGGPLKSQEVGNDVRQLLVYCWRLWTMYGLNV
jgi:hypothetical protein